MVEFHSWLPRATFGEKDSCSKI